MLMKQSYLLEFSDGRKEIRRATSLIQAVQGVQRPFDVYLVSVKEAPSKDSRELSSNGEV